MNKQSQKEKNWGTHERERERGKNNCFIKRKKKTDYVLSADKCTKCNPVEYTQKVGQSLRTQPKQCFSLLDSRNPRKQRNKQKSSNLKSTISLCARGMHLISKMRP